MKHVVEFFDGREVRGLLMDQKSLSGFLSKVEHLDPALGAIVLDVTSEKRWLAKKSLRRTQKAYFSSVDLERRTRVDQFLM